MRGLTIQLINLLRFLQRNRRKRSLQFNVFPEWRRCVNWLSNLRSVWAICPRMAQERRSP